LTVCCGFGWRLARCLLDAVCAGGRTGKTGGRGDKDTEGQGRRDFGLGGQGKDVAQKSKEDANNKRRNNEKTTKTPQDTNTRQQDNKTTTTQDIKTSRQQDIKTTRQQDNKGSEKRLVREDVRGEGRRGLTRANREGKSVSDEFPPAEDALETRLGLFARLRFLDGEEVAAPQLVHPATAARLCRLFLREPHLTVAVVAVVVGDVVLLLLLMCSKDEN